MRYLLPGFVLASLLSACGGGSAPETAPVPSAPPPRADLPAAATPDDTAAGATNLLSLADLAASEDRLFEPAGDNAFELYLRVIEADDLAADAGGSGRRRLLDSMADVDTRTQARAALSDLFPYGLMHAEQTWLRGSREDAERWVGLLARVRPDSPGLAKLRELIANGRPEPESRLEAARSPSGSSRSAIVATGDDFAPAEQPAPPSPSDSSKTAPQSFTTTSTTGAASQPAPRPAEVASSATSAEVGTFTPVNPIEPKPAQVAGSTDASAPSEPPPELQVQAAPRYPSRARRQQIEGWVAIRFRVAPDGSVDQVSVTAAEPEGVFDREAVGAVSRWKFAASDREHWLERRIDFLLNARP